MLLRQPLLLLVLLLVLLLLLAYNILTGASRSFALMYCAAAARRSAGRNLKWYSFESPSKSNQASTDSSTYVESVGGF